MQITAAALRSVHSFNLFLRVQLFKEVQDFCLEVGLPVTLEEIGVTTPEQVEIIAKNACVEGETIHNLAGDVQPVELYDAIMQTDAMGKIALGK